jgi:hypothetical protein
VADLAHDLLSAALPSRRAVIDLSRSLHAAALELAAATSQYHHIWSLRHDPDAVRSEGCRDALSDVRYRGIVRERVWRALEDYLRAVRDLTAEASRGSFLSENEAVALGHFDAFRIHQLVTAFELDIPY